MRMRKTQSPKKLKVYTAIVMTTLLYGCETWTVYCSHARQLNRFHISCLRRLFRTTWQDMPQTQRSSFKRAGLQSIHALLKEAQLRRAGHVVSDDRLSKRLLHRELSEGWIYTGGQNKRYKGSLKSSLKAFEINNEYWESLATERATWRDPKGS